MEESQQMMIKEGIIEYMKTKVGVERTVDEIKLYVEQHKVRIDKGSSALRNALFSLKKENPALINVRGGSSAFGHQTLLISYHRINDMKM